jgi:hypothetical protein
MAPVWSEHASRSWYAEQGLLALASGAGTGWDARRDATGSPGVTAAEAGPQQVATAPSRDKLTAHPRHTTKKIAAEAIFSREVGGGAGNRTPAQVRRRWSPTARLRNLIARLEHARRAFTGSSRGCRVALEGSRTSRLLSADVMK